MVNVKWLCFHAFISRLALKTPSFLSECAAVIALKFS